MMNKKIYIFILLMSILFTSCSYTASKPVEKQEFHMGTVITERVYGDNAHQAADAVMEKIQQIEAAMTINSPGGELNLLNSMSGKESVVLPSETLYVIETAKRFSELSQGSFDVTVGPLVKSWGIFTENPRVPASDEIERLKKLVNYKDILVDTGRFSVQLARSGQIVDLGGIAKGYSGDAAIEILKENGIKSAFVNLGGNVVVLGGKPDGSPWNVGVQNPRAENGRYLGILKVKDKAIVSSGDYERFFEKDGKRYHHILDPRTGYPADSGLIGTTIVADKSIDADALSTATFVLGLEKGMELVESLQGVEAIFITSDKKIYSTSGMKNIFTFNDESKEYQYVEKR